MGRTFSQGIPVNSLVESDMMMMMMMMIDVVCRPVRVLWKNKVKKMQTTLLCFLYGYQQQDLIPNFFVGVRSDYFLFFRFINPYIVGTLP